MELAHSLLLNESALERISDNKKSVFIFEWLRFLDKVLIAAHKSDIKEKQAKLVEQLVQQIYSSPGPPTRNLLARNLATVFSVGDTVDLFKTLNTCNDIMRSKDDSPSYLPIRLAAMTCLGAMFDKLGRMVGRSYEDTISVLVKWGKQAESQGRCEMMRCLEKVVTGLGTAVGVTYFKDIFKAAKNCLTDRAMAVRAAAAKCILALIIECPIGQPADVETLFSLSLRALEGSNYHVRCNLAKLIAVLLAKSLSPPSGYSGQQNKQKRYTTEEVLNLLSSGFLKGGGGFLKSATAASDMIKGTGSSIREIRVGITHAYVEFCRQQGSKWLEMNLSLFLHHVTSLAANPRANSSHVDSVYSRKCVQFILRSAFRWILSEQVQVVAAKEMCNLIGSSMESSMTASNSSSQSEEAFLEHQHTLVCLLHELGHLLLTLDTSVAPLLEAPTSITDKLFSVLLHPASCVRLAGAYALRSLAVALPNQLTALLDQCTQKLQTLKSNSEAVSGYSYALAALIAGVRHGQLGIPYAKGKQVFSLAEELLRSANQNSRLTLPRTQAGWFLLGACMTLGSAAIKPHLPRMLLLWKNAFPRSSKELEAEKSRGDAFTWQVTLEARAGALCTMQSFLEQCSGSDLVTEDTIRRLLAPLECALAMLPQMSGIVKTHGTQLKATAAMVRLRLYNVLLLLPPQAYTGAYNSLLRELVAEFTLTENAANTTTSLLRQLCHVDDSVILGSWLQETDHKAIEDQLQPNSASGSGALEHDAAALFLKQNQSHAEEDEEPGPLPLGVAVIDASVQLFGAVFPRVQNKHRLQMLEHFAECIKQAKSVRQQAVQMNIFTAFLCAMKKLSDNKTSFGGEHDLRKAAVTLIFGALGSTNPILRCAAGECLGRMAQVIGDARFIAEMAQSIFDRLRTVRDAVLRTGHSLTLGCLHRYVGGLSSGQHLNTSVGILLALAQDTNSPIVQVWSLHALALIADSGGPMFRSFVEPSLSLVLQLLLQVPPSLVDVHQCLGKVLAALITTVGPELQGNSGSVTTARLSCLICCAIMQDHSDSMVQAEAISCLQQLHMFAPRHVNLNTLVPHLCKCLNSRHLLLRRAAVACLRQLAQRESAEVCDLAIQLVASESRNITSSAVNKSGVNEFSVKSHHQATILPDSGVEGALFALLDTETDPALRKDIQETLLSLLHSQGRSQLVRWLSLVKAVLQAGKSNEESSTIVSAASSSKASSNQTVSGKNAKDDDDDEEDDDVTFQTPKEEESKQLAPRWPTRVFAIDCLRRLLAACEQSGEPQHFDLQLARELQSNNGRTDSLSLHLSDLVRMTFMAATSYSDKLRLQGLAALQDIIHKFANVPEPEFEGHVILEQYQAQVGAALRPAFAAETASDVTAAACEVCSAWIGSGVARDLSDLRRVHQLLVSSLNKLQMSGRNSTASTGQIYSESASTMEKLAVLRAWAEVYIIAMNKHSEETKLNNEIMEKKVTSDEQDDIRSTGSGASRGEDLLSLVKPELTSLTQNWLSALRDYALLSLPSHLTSQMPADGGAFYHAECADTSREHYRRNWVQILYAAALWLDSDAFQETPSNRNSEILNIDRFNLLIGICVEAMCNLVSKQPLETIQICLKSVDTLFNQPWPRQQLTKESQLTIEMLHVVHRVVLTRDCIDTHLLTISIVKKIIIAAKEKLDSEKATKQKQDSAANLTDEMGESSLQSGQSVVFSCLEVLLCALTRYLPRLPQLKQFSTTTASTATPNNSSSLVLPPAQSRSHERASHLIGCLLEPLASLLDLCSYQGAVIALPCILQLIVNTVQVSLFDPARLMNIEDSRDIEQQVVSSLQKISHHRFSQQPHSQWHRLIASALMSLIKHQHDSNHDSSMTTTTATVTPPSCCIQSIHLVSEVLARCPAAVLHYSDLRSTLTSSITSLWARTVNSQQHRLTLTKAISLLTDHHEMAVACYFVKAVSACVTRYLYTVPLPESRVDADLLLAGIHLLENVVSLASGEHRSGLLLLLVALLVAMLEKFNTANWKTTQKNSKSLAEEVRQHALTSLISVGPLYPEDFKRIMTSLPELKTQLESAIKAAKLSASSKDAASKRTALNLSSVTNPIKPTIQLKTDFSNFK